jgi:hypothetical protein
MTNNNLADISTFESIQAEQHNRTSMSSMSVFNGDDPKEDIENGDEKVVTNAIDAKREVSAVEAKLKEVWARFNDEKKRLEIATARLKDAKQSNDKQATEKRLMITHLQRIG